MLSWLSVALVMAFANPCGDFFNYSCQQRNQGRDDSTGQVRDIAQLTERLNAIETEEQVKFRESFRKFMLGPQNSSVKNEILKESQCAQGQSPGKCPGFLSRIDDAADVLFSMKVATGALSEEASNQQPLPMQMPLSVYQKLLYNKEITPIVESAQQRIDQRIVPLERQNYIKNTVFPKVQEAIIQVLNRLPESSQKKLAIERVRTVKIKTEYCDGDRDMVLLPNAYYSPNSHTFNFCLNQMFRAESLFSTIFIMAHEISHSIDPCVLMQNPPVFDRLTSCFAQPQSVGANIGCNRDNIGFQCDPRPLSGETPIGCGPGSTPDKCLPLESTRPAPNCYATTQIQNTPQDGEVFSDWMGAEVLGALASGQFAPMRNLSREQHAIGLANAFPFCEFSGSVVQSREGNTYEHLLDRDRFNLLASQPSIRQNMGCESAGPQMYCTLEGSASPAPSETTAPSPTQGVAQ